MGGQTALNLAKALSEVTCLTSQHLHSVMWHVGGMKRHCRTMQITKSVDLQQGILDKYGVELIGAKLPSINKAEDRELFKNAMADIGLKTPPSGIAETMDDALRIHKEIGAFPLIIRPAFTLGGSGGGIAYNMEEYHEIITSGLSASPTTQVPP
jgi:carbamoyl-phosphate synthase large subunit